MHLVPTKYFFCPGNTWTEHQTLTSMQSAPGHEHKRFKFKKEKSVRNVYLRVRWLIIPKSCKFSIWAHRLQEEFHMHIWLCEQTFVKDVHHYWPRLALKSHEPSLPSPRSISLVVPLKRVYLRVFSGSTLAVPSRTWCLRALHSITQTEAIPRSWQRHAGIWDMPPHSTTHFVPPGGHDFPSNTSKSNLQQWTG